ncbi:hypothetical protein BC826DRAFT_973535 [Russula brevipes]|nr:hypothetical protein BC826DRAFT_973535 [Russula brevipes]
MPLTRGAIAAQQGFPTVTRSPRRRLPFSFTFTQPAMIDELNAMSSPRPHSTDERQHLCSSDLRVLLARRDQDYDANKSRQPPCLPALPVTPISSTSLGLVLVRAAARVIRTPRRLSRGHHTHLTGTVAHSSCVQVMGHTPPTYSPWTMTTL